MRQRWEDWLNLVLGAWLFISPWLLGYSNATAAAWNAYIVGAAFAIFALIALGKPDRWEEWVNVVIGAWAVISPWVLGYAAVTAATWNAVIVGAIVLLVSLEATRAQRQQGTMAH